MAGELKHKSAGTQLTSIEDDAITRHVLDSQAVGDLIHAAATTYLSRLAIGSTDDLLAIVSGLPAWVSSFMPLVHFLRSGGYLRLIQFDDLQFTDVAGTTDIARQTQLMNIKITNGDTEVGRSYMYITCLSMGATHTAVNWDKELFFQLSLRRYTAEANAIGYVQIKDVNTEGDLANDGIGIKVANLTLTGNCWGGGNHSGELALATMVHDDVILVGIHHKPAEFVKFYVNGVLTATEETDVPSGAENAIFVVSYKTTGAASADNYIHVFNPIIIQAF